MEITGGGSDNDNDDVDDDADEYTPEADVPLMREDKESDGQEGDEGDREEGAPLPPAA